jgi:conjugal transfer/entry exclusion protein
MKEAIEKLLKIVEKIESLQVSIEILQSNIKTYPSEFVDLIEDDKRKIRRNSDEIDRLEFKISEISKTLTR